MNDNKIKHLEFIQSSIDRMNRNAFQAKGWAITIVSAFMAVYAATKESAFLLVPIVPAVVFWFLDSYYLQQERKFRGIYNDVCELTEAIKRNQVRDFDMPLNKYRGGKYCYLRVLFSRTEWPVYLPIIVALVLICLYKSGCTLLGFGG